MREDPVPGVGGDAGHAGALIGTRTLADKFRSGLAGSVGNSMPPTSCERRDAGT
jgi:hypothetical protein